MPTFSFLHTPAILANSLQREQNAPLPLVLSEDKTNPKLRWYI